MESRCELCVQIQAAFDRFSIKNRQQFLHHQQNDDGLLVESPLFNFDDDIENARGAFSKI